MTPNLNECWRWPQGHRRREDQRPTSNGRYIYRLLYEAATGQPLNRLTVLHHTCGNAWCVNPTHVVPMSQSDHMKTHGAGGDWGQADKTVCRNGHPYDEENTYYYTRKDGRNERHCKTCLRSNAKANRAKRR